MYEQVGLRFGQNGEGREEEYYAGRTEATLGTAGESARKTLAKSQTGPAAEDLTGRKFGRMKVKAFAGRDKRRRIIWLCICECGVEKTVKGSSLKNNHTRSCGCLGREILQANAVTHGKYNTVEYSRWLSMKARCACKNPAKQEYKDYVMRGITVCERWLTSFEVFLQDMGPIPTARHTLDRRDNDKGYELGNCRWATRHEQMNNCRNNVLITALGKTQTMAQWSRELNFGRGVIQGRIRRGDKGDRLLRPTHA